MTCEFAVTTALVDAGLYRYLTAVLRKRLAIVGLCLLIFGYLAFSPSVRPVLKAAMLAMVAVSTLAFVARLLGTRRRSRRLLAKLGGEIRATLTVTANAVVLENSMGISKIPWQLLETIWVFDDVWLLFLGDVDYMTVPSRALGEEGGQALLRLAREKGKRIHGKGPS